MTFKDLLIQLDACESAREWAGDMPIEEVVATCHRGDWLLWLTKRVDADLRLRTLAKGHCANTVRHLMTDERSLNAVDVAIAFGEGKATREELDAAADASRAAADAAYAAAADAYAAAAYAAYAAAAAPYDDAAACGALNRQQTADICREYIGESLIQKVNQLL
jgi:prophage DNA circulation protein